MLRPYFYPPLLCLMFLLLGACQGDDAPRELAASVDPQRQWVLERVDAVVGLYGITPQGVEMLLGLDVRQMRGKPGWFGSLGFNKWTGVGSAQPGGVIHELSHAYWGAFPVTGLPELRWDVSSGAASAMERYHRDVLTFLEQPPDQYEPLRRRLPKRDLDSLFHFVEADLVTSVAGDLGLLPPILRKYWEQFLEPGPFHSWPQAIAWYQALPAEGRSVIDRYTGYPHMDLRRYGTQAGEPPSQLPPGARGILRNEERQQLWDFAEQFDLLLGSPEKEEDFNFWRRHLREIRDLHRRHAAQLSSSELPRAPEIVRALDALIAVERADPAEREGMILQGLGDHPFLANFLPALDNRTLLALFQSGSPLPEGGTIRATGAFVELLKEVTPDVDRILREGQADAARGASELRSFLEESDFGEGTDLDVFFSVLQDTGGDLAREIVAALDDTTLRRLFKVEEEGYLPARLRAVMDPARMLFMLDVTVDAPDEALARGIEDLVGHPSGNFIIDEPFIDALYEVVASRGARDPRGTLSVMAQAPFPMERFIIHHPQAAVTVLASDPEAAVRLIAASDPLDLPPLRFLHRLVHADPDFAASLVALMDRGGEGALAADSLAQMAYDADRLAIYPDLPISLEADGRFLRALAEGKGTRWLEDALRRGVEVYRGRVAAQESPADFLQAFRRTLDAAALTLADDGVRLDLAAAVEGAFRPPGSGKAS